MEEIWKEIPGYEGKYQASNYGEIRSLNYMRTGTVKILKKVIDRYGYFQTVLCKNGIAKTLTVHRLIAMAFLSNPNKLPQVNHKDENRQNNFVWVNEDGSVDPNKSNLEWCDCLYNNNYGTANKKRITNRTGKTAERQILQIKNDVVINEFKSITEAAIKALGDKKYNSQISAVCRNKQKTAHGYKWQYKRG